MAVSHDPFGSDIRQLWQKQPMQEGIMSAEQIREKARRIQTAMLRGYFISGTVVLLGISLSLYIGLLRAQGTRPPGMPERIIVGMIAALLCGGFLKRLYSSYRIHGRIWPRIVTSDAKLVPCLDFYRTELEHRLNRLMGPKIPIFYIGLALVSLFLFSIVAKSQSVPIQSVLPALITVALLIGICTILLLYAWKREVRRLQREIDQLDSSVR